jgi:hypothetical protein
MNKYAMTYVLNTFFEEVCLVYQNISTDEAELLKDNALGLATSISCLSFDGENVFPQLFQELNGEEFDEFFRLRVDLLIEKCRSLSDALGNVAMLLELMQTHYPKEKEVASIDISASA